MQNDNYVIDEKRGQAWNDPSEAAKWYAEQLDNAQAALAELLECLPHLIRVAELVCMDDEWTAKAKVHIQIYEDALLSKENCP